MKKLVLKMTTSLVLMISMSPFASNAADPALFANAMNYDAGLGPSSVISGDFNGDGKADMAVAVHRDWSVSIYLGNGDGTFQPRVDYATTGGPYYITKGDFNGDGRLDLATTNRWYDWENNNVSILLGNGDGTFQIKESYFTWRDPGPIATGDFNNDGKVDLVTTDVVNLGIVLIYIGNGDGTFQRQELNVGIGTYVGATGDFNGDGNVDLITTNIYYSTISVFLGNGDGTFQRRIDCSIGDSIFSVIPQDFNGDGKLDLAFANWGGYGGHTVSILLGNGDGTFQPRVAYNYGGNWYTDIATPLSIVSGDFNMDGKLDIAATSFYGLCWASSCGVYDSHIRILIGNGDGTFQLDPLHYATGTGPVNIAASDVNNDGKEDLVTANVYGNTISVLLNTYNQPPLANAGPDQAVECAGPSGTTVTLDGSGSSDPDGDSLTYAWTWLGGSAEGVNPTVQLPLGTTVVTLTVSDGKATATDTVSIAVQDTMPPVTTATGGNGDWYNTNVISTFTAYDSCSGVKEIHYIVNGSETVTPGSYATAALTADGIFNISYFAVDNAGNAEAPKAMTVKIDKTPPAVSINTDPGILWPPNHKMVDVLVGGGATDALSGLASIVFTVRDEYGIVQPSLSDFNTTISLEAWRGGTDKDGRRYTITATATDAAGNKSVATTEVLVPHDQR